MKHMREVDGGSLEYSAKYNDPGAYADDCNREVISLTELAPKTMQLLEIFR